MAKRYKVRINISNTENCYREYTVTANYLQEAINLCLYDIEKLQRNDIIKVLGNQLPDDYAGNLNTLFIFNKQGRLVKNLILSDDFYNN